jgi:hypothetical protein
VAKYLCLKNQIISGYVYEAGNVYDFSANPGANFRATGDEPQGKYTLSRDLDGTLYFPNTNWEDLRFPAQAINPPGAASDPTVDTDDACLVFSKSAQNIIAGVAQLPHSWKLGTPIEVHIHWQIPTDANGNVVWRFEYACADLLGTFPASYTSTDVTVAVDEYGVRQHIISELVWLTPGTNISAMIKWKLSRMGAATGDTYDDTVKLLELDFHYQIDSVGSGREREK